MFVLGLMSLVRNVQRAIQLHDDLSQSTKSPAELLTGCFNGIKVCMPFSSSLVFFFFTFFPLNFWNDNLHYTHGRVRGSYDSCVINCYRKQICIRHFRITCRR